jgi:hypothetical protein
MTKTLIALALLALPVGAGAADLQTTLDSQKKLNKSLLGTTHMVAMFPNGAPIGIATIELAKAPKSSGSTYQGNLEINIEMGGFAKMTGSATWELGKDLSARRYKRQVENQAPGTTKATLDTDDWSVADGLWTAVVSRAGESHSSELTPDGTVYGQSFALLSLAATLHSADPGELTLSTLQWSKKENKLNQVPLKITVNPPKEIEHLGQTVTATQVMMQFSRQNWEFAFSQTGELYRVLDGEGGAMKLVACEPEQCVELNKVPPLDEVGERIAQLLEVQKEGAPIENLDQIVDWDRCASAFMSRRDAALPAPTTEQIVTAIKTHFNKGQAPIPGSKVRDVLPFLLQTSVDGDNATANMLGNSTIPMERIDGTWKVVDLGQIHPDRVIERTLPQPDSAPDEEKK